MSTIKVNRQSVCMADDLEDHQITIDINYKLTFDELLKLLIQKEFFPKIYGNDVIWVLTLKGEDLLSYVTKSNKIYSCFIENIPNVVSRVAHNNEIFFKYFSSQLKRAEFIFKKFNGIKYHIWHEGYLSEYESYNISNGQEKKWASEMEL